MSIIKRLLSLEPVAVQAVIRAVFVLAGTVGLTVSDDLSGRVLAAVAAVYALIEIATTVWARSKVTPQDKVVTSFRAEDGALIAGPASTSPTGSIVGY